QLHGSDCGADRPAPRRPPALRHRPRRVGAARLAQEEKGKRVACFLRLRKNQSSGIFLAGAFSFAERGSNQPPKSARTNRGARHRERDLTTPPSKRAGTVEDPAGIVAKFARACTHYRANRMSAFGGTPDIEWAWPKADLGTFAGAYRFSCG